MKKTTLIALTALAAIAMLVPAGSAMAQSSTSANANATATIVTPITLTRTADLRFGEVVASTADGTVVITSGGAKSATGGVTALSGLPHGAAAFTVGGGANRTFSITIPTTDVTITKIASTETMTVNAFTSSLGSSGTLSSGGAATLNVGGTLNVGASQTTGNYSGEFSVTVAYN
ncbi:MAG: DUF4402 domain-containing protein [Thermoanaerobaculia bacterium]|nr:DUF4402 domain-containing protein [Thermoanaerobaculia bacterium]